LSKLIVGDTRKDKKSDGGGGSGQQVSNLLGETNFRQDGDFSHIRTSNLYHYNVPDQFMGQKYKALFKYLVTKRFIIPLGIYRTEMVSFQALDPAYEEENSNASGDNDESGAQHDESGEEGHKKKHP
jgi:hypothetical protein